MRATMDYSELSVFRGLGFSGNSIFPQREHGDQRQLYFCGTPWTYYYSYRRGIICHVFWMKTSSSELAEVNLSAVERLYAFCAGTTCWLPHGRVGRGDPGNKLGRRSCMRDDESGVIFRVMIKRVRVCSSKRSYDYSYNLYTLTSTCNYNRALTGLWNTAQDMVSSTLR